MELEDASVEPRRGFHLAVLGPHGRADIGQLEAHLRLRAKEELETRYLAPNRHRAGWILAEKHDGPRGRLAWHEGSEVGTPYDVVVDGMTLSWEELGQALEAYEGWRFVLRLDDPCDDLRPDASVLPLRQVPKTPDSSAGVDDQSGTKSPKDPSAPVGYDLPTFDDGL